ncbi:MAG: nuclear transport factor 2 family protein [Candidatus Sulfotelmatobacter sp.]
MWKLLTIFLLLAPRLSAQAASAPDGDRGRILSLENAWNQATQQKDVKALDPLLAEGLIYINNEGTEMNRAQYLASVSAPERRFEHIVSESMRVQLFGQSAVVVGVYHEKGVKDGKPYLHNGRFIDTWIHRGDSWMCVASQSTLILHEGER